MIPGTMLFLVHNACITPEGVFRIRLLTATRKSCSNEIWSLQKNNFVWWINYPLHSHWDGPICLPCTEHERGMCGHALNREDAKNAGRRQATKGRTYALLPSAKRFFGKSGSASAPTGCTIPAPNTKAAPLWTNRLRSLFCVLAASSSPLLALSSTEIAAARERGVVESACGTARNAAAACSPSSKMPTIERAISILTISSVALALEVQE